MNFVYQAIGRGGRVVSGRVGVVSLEVLRADLARAGLTLVDARQDYLGDLVAVLMPRRLSRAELIDLFGFLKGLIGMGMDMLTSWQSVGEALSTKLAKETASSVHAAIAQGYSLADAMERTKVFPQLVIGNVRAGEVSGTLEEVFGALETTYRQEAALAQQLAKATIYPLISVTVLFLIGTYLLTSVVPDLKQIFPPKVPLTTRLLVYVSESLIDYWWTVPGFVGLVVAGWWRLPDNARARASELLYKVPMLGPSLKNVALCNLFDNLALMLGAGVNLITALEIVADATKSVAIRRRLDNVLLSIQRGGKFSDGFRDPFFPNVTAGVLLQGETTGNIDTYLKRLATFLRDRAQARLATLATMLEPLILLIGGGMLLFLAVGMFMPIYGSMKRGGH